jgi:cytochrome c peroxidase
MNNEIPMKNPIFILTVTLLLAIILVISCKPSAQDTEVSTQLNRKEQLGKMLFFEKGLSTPVGQDCSDCHKPELAFADPDTGLPVSKGVVEGRYGNRNDLSAAYAAFIPPLHKDTVEDIWVGGLFWDGRANSLEEQAMGPPLNPLEMANLDTVSIRDKLRELDYADMFKEIYGPDALDDSSAAFRHMADAIAAYERSAELNRFDSKYDLFLRGEAELSEQEIRGMGLFVSENRGNCVACHPSSPSPDGTPPLFTDFTYDNLGAPRNPENPFYTLSPELNPDGFDYVDLGLALTVKDPAENGKFRVPTLRNVALTPPYMHNGVFKTLYQVVAFYNTRDVAPWPPPEVAENVNDEELGNLGLTNQEVEDIVAFLETLTDGWEPAQPSQE